jgi:DNA-binding SARP family transcriptional activator
VHELSPDDERALRHLMTVRWAQGDRAGALRDFQGFERRLSLELDLAPADATRSLAEEIRKEQQAPACHVARFPSGDDAYWRGLVHWSRRTPDDMRKAACWFRQSMERNPSSCEAHAALL